MSKSVTATADKKIKQLVATETDFKFNCSFLKTVFPEQ
jgi:hypothetical protein